MSSILNSISSGGLRVQEAPGVTPKTDSIIDILKNSEIEFNTCPAFKNNIGSFNTGFGENNDLHYKTACSKPKLNVPLYKENYLQEFITEEEKAAARHALGLYNKGDVVAMSLLTAEDSVPSKEDIAKAAIKQMRKGDSLFLPVTSAAAVFDSTGVSLEYKIKDIQKALTNTNQDIKAILQPSNNKEISSLGDVTLFLKGFNNGNILKDTIETITDSVDSINQEMLRFEITGQM